MNALIVTHHPEEGPGLLEAILREQGWEMDRVGLWNGDRLPDPIPFLMGGPMSVNDDAVHPFLEKEKQFVRQWLHTGNPTVGICLGAQLIAHCLGGRVYKGPTEEIGWHDLFLTEEGRRDPCLKFFPVRFPVFQWHGETFDLPDDAILLATSDAYPHQAFSYRDSIYAFQFHVEMTERMIQGWLVESDVSDAKKGSILSALRVRLPAIHQACRNFMHPFLRTIEKGCDANTHKHHTAAEG
jgi:GMP synthase (glutamine-hydrolysing)